MLLKNLIWNSVAIILVVNIISTNWQLKTIDLRKCQAQRLEDNKLYVHTLEVILHKIEKITGVDKTVRKILGSYKIGKIRIVDSTKSRFIGGEK